MDLDFLPGTGAGPGVFSTVVFFSVKPAARFFDTFTGKETVPPIPLSADASCGRFSPDGRLFVVGQPRGSSRLYDWRTGESACPEVPHESTTWSAAFVPGTSWCLSGTERGSVHLWDGATGRLLVRPWLTDGRQPVANLRVSPDGRYALVTRYGSGKLSIRDLHALRDDFALDVEGSRLLAEINANASVHPGGETVDLDPDQWLERWRELRRRHPEFHKMPGTEQAR
jgi:WD40 repeat protein